MDPQASPPKRMTRARAAKVGESSTAVKTTRIMTASAKAQAAPATRRTAAASTKRKTRADEVEDEDNNDQDDELAEPEPATKTRTRGRPKKAAEPEPEVETAPATRTRGRPKKTAEPSKEETQPTKPATRTTRTKKATVQQTEASAEPAKKPAARTRGSATAPTKSTAAKSAVPKKTVKFEEPQKENIEPAPTKTARGKAVETPTSGLRAKPVRRAAAAASSAAARTSTRAGAGASKTSGQESKYEKPTPLSPKKVTQMALHNRANISKSESMAPESEDELAADEKTSSAKPRARAMSATKVRGGMKLQVPREVPKTAGAQSDENEVVETEPAPTVILGSPCRRPPPSPWKDSMKTPAKRVDGVPALAQSAVRPPSRLFDSEIGQQQHQPQSAFKASLLASPAKRVPQSALKGLDLRPAGSMQLGAPSPFKTSLFSPPKRPMSPSKPAFLGLSSPRKQQDDDTVFGRTPAPKPTLLATPLATERSVQEGTGRRAGNVDIPEDVEEEERDPNRLLFPGRMSAVLPRHADPALDQEEVEHEELEVEPDQQEVQHDANQVDLVLEDNPGVEEDHMDDPMHLDEPEPDLPSVMARQDREATTTPPASPPQQQQQRQHPPTGFFGLREKDLNPQDDDTESEDEDELATTETLMPATPCRPPTSRTTTSNVMSVRSAHFGERSTVKRARTDDKIGFTPLIGKLNAWGTASSPLKMGRPESPGIDILSQDNEEPQVKSPVVTASPMRNTYFEEAIAQTNIQELESGTGDDVARDEHVDEHEAEESQDDHEALDDQHEQVEEHNHAEPMDEDFVLTPEFDDIPVTEEDISLAAEAHEMSLMGPGQVEDMLHDHDNDALSEASQEYGDENAIPIDPTLLVPPVTPQRNFSSVREVRTTSKVPLKPADDSTPRPRVKRRGHSISRLPVQSQSSSSSSRPTHGLQRNATVISYSPTKQSTQIEDVVVAEERGESAPPLSGPVTPAKSEWSVADTPARTPRRDLNPALLRGAVVFVDVHTSEGADASGIFVELLAQMGARCVKTWTWNPSSPPQDGSQGGRIGITHVVYKDGGKRTLEKVRESGGVVQCVGVSWVLDCERENKWLDEAPYYIDTSLVPRGGARRRKSMEPKALKNMNGEVLVDNTPAKAANKLSAPECQSLPATPINPSSSRRRDSSLWMRTPPEHNTSPEDHDEEVADWEEEGVSLLMPVPKTPAPEQIARYAAAVTLEATPTMEVESESGEEERREMMTRTCPPKSTSVYHELGEGVLRREKDEGVLMRLMAARRKSLQFAPKIGSPLARTWQ